VRVAKVEDERATGVGKVLTLVVRISNALVDLGTLPIRDIPQLPKTTRKVLARLVSSWSVCEGSMPPALDPGTET
jgi:hypothetical protein